MIYASDMTSDASYYYIKMPNILSAIRLQAIIAFGMPNSNLQIVEMLHMKTCVRYILSGLLNSENM